MGEGGYILGIPVLVYVMGYCSDTKWNAFSNSPLGLLVIILLVALVGFITGFVGAGGGFMIISVLVHFLRLELKKNHWHITMYYSPKFINWVSR